MSNVITSRLKNVVALIEPSRGEKIDLSPDEVRFRSLLILMRDKTVSYRDAMMIVGGKVRLEQLMIDGKIRGFKPAGNSNRCWRINAADCYAHVKPRLKEVLKTYNKVPSAV